jgi:hypothetical protein
LATHTVPKAGQRLADAAAAARAEGHPDVADVADVVVERLARSGRWRIEHAEWSEPYLDLRLRGVEHTIQLEYGDGYLDVEIDGFDQQGYLPPDELAALLVAAVDGRLTLVRCSRLGLTVQRFLEAGEQRWFTRSYQVPGALLALVPGLTDRVERCRIG